MGFLSFLSFGCGGCLFVWRKLLTVTSVVVFSSLLYAADPEAVMKSQWSAATLVKKESLLLTGDEIKIVNQLARVPSKDRIYRYYTALKDDQIIGYGFITSQMVRTKTMALLVMISPQGKVAAIEVLAFYEPPEYEPEEKWLRDFTGKSQSDQLRLKKNVVNISGATLSARAVVQKARLILAIFNQKIAGQRP